MIPTCRHLLAVPALAALAACSSGPTGPAPVLAPPGPIAPGDFIGKTFPVRYFGGKNIGTITGIRGTGTIEVVAGDIVNLTIDGVTYALTDPLPFDGVFTDGAAAFELNGFSPAVIGFDGANGVDTLAYGVYGFQTDPANMPMPGAGTVAYTSIQTSSLILYRDDAADELSGNTALLVNFDNGTLGGIMFANIDTVMRLENGTISGNTFSGTVSATFDDGLGGGPQDYPTVNSDVDGWFYNQNGEDIVATYEGDFAFPLDGYDSFVGGFLADD